jgi:hypothetical protein
MTDIIREMIIHAGEVLYRLAGYKPAKAPLIYRRTRIPTT